MSKVGEYYREREEMGLEPDTIVSFKQLVDEEEPQSNCCSVPFGYPGWPDNDICSRCGEHAEPGDEDG